MNPIQIVFMILHLFIQILWAVTSRGKNFEAFFKTWTQPRSVPIATFVAVAFVQALFLPSLTFPMWDASFPTQVVGLAISIAGVILASWAKIVMGTNWGRPAQHDRQNQSRLVTTGPFAYSRNPIYVGLFLLFTGQQLTLGSYGIALSIVFGAAIQKAVTIEENLLNNFFGKEYAEYTNRVPRYM